MAGAEAQAGFYYQNVVAAGYALDLIEFGSSLRSITLESQEQAKHIDDIIADYIDKTKFVQVKWALDQNSALTLHNLVNAESDSSPFCLNSYAATSRFVKSLGRKKLSFSPLDRLGETGSLT